MIRDLRKGTTTIEYWHQFGAEHVRVIQTKVELKGDLAIIRSTLKPASGDQKNDADSYIKGGKVTKFIIKDEQVYKKLREFISFRKGEITSFVLELLDSQAYMFPVKINISNHGEIALDVKA